MNTTRLLYLPGIDGTHGSGEGLFELLPEVCCQQASYPSETSDSLEAMAEWVVDSFLPSVGWDEGEVHLVGESYGAALAQVLAQLNPKRFSRVLLLAGFSALPRRKIALTTAFFLRWLPSALVKWPIRFVARPLLLQRTTREERAKFYAAIEEIPMRDLAMRIRALKSFDGRALTPRAMPTIWLWGEADTLMNHLAERKWLKTNAPKELVVMIGQAGHVLMRSQGETLAMHVRRFIGLPTRSGHLPAKSQ